jgi:uncharacterized protein YgbK (DUF1537 family)
MESSHSQLLLCFYGDDYTGSVDSMEALMINGVKTVLFLEVPSLQLLADRFPDIRAFGVAGISRSMDPAQMEIELRPILEQLSTFGTTIVHYKICSTFDSSPHVGSIGKAIDIGAEVFRRQAYTPLLVGAPVLKRYTLFGNHYAGVLDRVYRLDRHPTMSRHPVTPMDESDLRVHLSKQTDKSIALIDIHDLEGDIEDVRQRLRTRLASQPEVLLYDVFDAARLKAAGQLLWEEAVHDSSRFVVGSSGVEYALTAFWKECGLVHPKHPDDENNRSLEAVDQMLAVSGSCSPVTESQLKYAMKHGFAGIKVQTEKLIDPEHSESVKQLLLSHTADILRTGRSVILYTAMGPEDANIDSIQQILRAQGRSAADTSQLLGTQLGLLTKQILMNNRLGRLLVAGGDTSGYVTRELGIYAIESLTPIAPGGPLCKGYSEEPRFDGIEIALKGGQVGSEDYFIRVLEGQ